MTFSCGEKHKQLLALEVLLEDLWPMMTIHPSHPSVLHEASKSSKQASDWSESTSNDLQRPKMTYDDLRRLHYDSILATFWLHSDYTLITFWLHSDYIQTVSSRFNDQLNSMIYDLKRSVELRCLIDLVLHSSIDDLVSTFFACFLNIVEFVWRIKRRW